MLFGTSKKLKVVGGKLSLKFGHLDISPTKRYTYLGTLIDPSLNLNENFIRTYKKASSRLRLLSVLRCYLTIKAAKDVFTMMVLPLLTFNSITNLSLNRTQLDRLRSLDNRANEIVNRNSEAKVQIKLRRSIDIIRGQACVTVRKCIDRKICSNFQNYFTIYQTNISTRNNGSLLQVPKIKLELARKGFYFYGATLYNSLPRSIREESNFDGFKQRVSTHIF